MTYLPAACFGDPTMLSGGNDGLQARFLARMAAGELHTALALPEPEAASDAGPMKTSGKPAGWPGIGASAESVRLAVEGIFGGPHQPRR